MLSIACLLAILAVYSAVRIVRYVVGVLELDVWDALVYLGLAEYHEPPPASLDASR